MAMNKLMEFRAIVLRSITEAWADQDRHPDPHFRGFRWRLLNEDPTVVIQEKFNFVWPWKNACKLQFHDAEGKSAFIEEHRGRGKWLWSPMIENEDLTMNLPLDPDVLDTPVPPEYRAQALADYYRARPSLFTDDWGMHDNPNELPDPRRSAGGYVPAGTDFDNFMVVLLEAMAVAWADPVFRAELDINCVGALRARFGYILPWNLVINVQNDANARWNPPDGKSQSYWDLPTPHALHLNLPGKPQEPRTEPVALGAYNAIGAKYPFTCCMGSTS